MTNTDQIDYEMVEHYLSKITDPLDAVMILEGGDDCANQEMFVAAAQYLIDTRLVYSLQGSYGRLAQSFIEQGVCHHD